MCSPDVNLYLALTALAEPMTAPTDFKRPSTFREALSLYEASEWGSSGLVHDYFKALVKHEVDLFYETHHSTFDMERVY
jgi:hypothetical protein